MMTPTITDRPALCSIVLDDREGELQLEGSELVDMSRCDIKSEIVWNFKRVFQKGNKNLTMSLLLNGCEIVRLDSDICVGTGDCIYVTYTLTWLYGDSDGPIPGRGPSPNAVLYLYFQAA